MAMAYADQQGVIATLTEIGDPDLTARLERCMKAHRERHFGDGWPYSCRSAACIWCRRAMIRGWWFGMREWSSVVTASLAIIPVLSQAGLSDAVRRLRRGLRDVRDRTARRWRQWRQVCLAGLMGGDHRALVVISHEGVDRREVIGMLSRRWPDVVVKELEQEEPASTMTAGDAADLGSRRRGVEPLRIVVMPQRVQRVTVMPALVIEPMPVVV
jgi:hypothetical protein